MRSHLPSSLPLSLGLLALFPLLLLSALPAVLAAGGAGTYQLLSNQNLTAGQSLFTTAGPLYQLLVTANGDVIVQAIATQTITWNAGVTCGSPFLVMQSDCNLVLYSWPPGRSEVAVWASHSNVGSGCSLQMQNDGNLVIYNGTGKAIWATGTNEGPLKAVLDCQPESHCWTVPAQSEGAIPCNSHQCW